jgi:hypothetical protein
MGSSDTLITDLLSFLWREEKNIPISWLKPHFFKFEARWLQEEGCAELVEKAWTEAFSAGSLTVKEGLQDVSWVIWDWDKNVLGDLEKRIKKQRRSFRRA